MKIGKAAPLARRKSPSLSRPQCSDGSKGPDGVPDTHFCPNTSCSGSVPTERLSRHSLAHHLSTPASPLAHAMGSVGEWQTLAQKCVDIQQNSIPKQWLVLSNLLPPKSQHVVVDTPKTTGSLTALELEITQQDARGLLDRYRSGTWSVRQVVTAFLKRATLGQQLVRHMLEPSMQTRLTKISSTLQPSS